MLTRNKKRYRKFGNNLKKIINFLAYFKYVFFILIFLSFFSGFSPLHIINKILFAEDDNTEIINLYAFKAQTNSKDDNYEMGWHNTDNAIKETSLGPDSGMIDFSGENSAFYSGGNSDLTLGDFNFLETDLLKEKKEASSSDESLGDEDLNLEEKKASSSDVLLDSNYEKNLDDDLENSEILPKEEIASSSLENFREEHKIASSSSEKLADEEGNIQSSSSSPKILEDQDNKIEDNSSNSEGSEVEILDNENIDDSSVTIMEGDNQEEKFNEVEIKEEKDVLDEKNLEEDSTDAELEAETDQENLDQGKVSFLNKIKNIFNKAYAHAQEYLDQDIKSLDDLGEFKSAKINFSLALGKLSESKKSELKGEFENIVNKESSTTIDKEINEESQEGSLEHGIDENKDELEQGVESQEEDKNLQDTLEPEASSESSFSVDEEENETQNLESENQNLEDNQSDVSSSDQIKESEDQIISDDQSEVSIVEEEDDHKKVEILEEDGGTENSSNAENMDEDSSDAENMDEDSFDDEALEDGLSDAEAMEDGENPLLEFINKAKAQDGNLEDAKIIIWYSLDKLISTSSASSTDFEEHRFWKKLDTISADNISNYLNQGYFSYNADFLNSWDDVKNLKIKLEGLSEGKSDFLFYLDSAWVEAKYLRETELDKLKKRERWENALEFLSEKKVFSSSDQTEFRFRYNKNENRIWDTLEEIIGSGNFWKDVNLSVDLINPQGEKSKEDLSIIFEEDGEFSIKLNNDDRRLKPGKYTFSFHIEDKSGEEDEVFDIDKSFSWGVLAMNFDKSVYEINDAGEISMATLDSDGHTICDANLYLEIIKPDGEKVYYATEESTTTNGLIIRNPNCGPDNVEHRPDYYLNYNFSEEGFYKLNLKSRHNNLAWKSINETIEVRERVPFILKRNGPTRIYPRANYKMLFDLMPRENYEGDFTEYVPSGFDIVDWKVEIASGTDFIDYNDYKNSLDLATNTDLIIKTEDGQKKLTWTNLKLSPQTRFQISYTFDAPNISPELYLLGPAEVENFKEARQWQIAADAQDSFRVTEYYINSGFTGTTYELTLDNDLNPNNYILVRGSAYLDTTRGADDNYARVDQLPEGMNGDLAASSAANKIRLARYASDGDWEGVVTVVESLGDNDHSGFRRRDVINLTTSGAATSGTDTSSTEWASSSQVVLFGGAFGAGSNVEVADASAYYHTSAWLRLWPTSTSTINWERYDGGGRGLQTAEHTVYVIEWGDEWKVQHVNVDTSAGGNGIDATSEYTTASIDSVTRANTWVWGTGHRQDDGIGDGAESMAITLGDGVNKNTTENTVALGSEYSDAGSFDVYVMTHNNLAVDYQFKSDGNSADNDVNITVNSASSGYRMSWVTNGVNGTGNAYPRPIFSAHYTSDNNVLISRGYDGQDFPAWVEGIDFSGITYNIPPTGTFNSAEQKKDASGAVDVSIEIDDDEDDDVHAKIEYVSGASCDFSSALDPTLDESDSNITADFGDPSIENDNNYQIGTTSAMILTSSGSNTVNFDWLSGSDVVSSGTTYCLRLTANDGEDDQSPLATTTVYVDNVAPTTPGNLSFNSRTGSSITLNFGATSTEENFLEYKIFYKEYDGSDPEETDSLHSSSTDINLGDILFNSKSTTTISGLSAGTKYSFAIWAYDDYGYKASSSRVDIIANDAPLGTFNSLNQKTDGSGVVDISIEVDDNNNDNTNVAKIEYAPGSDCNFSSSLDPSLDTSNVSADFGLPVIDNNEDYQVGSSSGYILSSAGSNTVDFDWLGEVDEPSADGTYCLRLTVNDGVDDQAESATGTLVLDNINPSPSGDLSYDEIGINSLRLVFATTSPGVDTNEPSVNAYKIFYKKGVAGVRESDNEHDSSSLDAYDYNGATSTLVSGLDANTDYVFNIWTYDSFGNKASSSEITIKTNSTLVNESLSFTNPVSANIALAGDSLEWNFRAEVSETNGWYALDTVKLRLADNSDELSPFEDLEFSWDQSANVFSESGNDVLNVASISENSTSTCASNTCTLDFKIIFNKDFASTSVDYDAELISTNDNAVVDEDSYSAFYQVRKFFIEQIHYRWRNDDGGE